MKQTSRSQPVKLQRNNSGAWKDVIHFDAASDIGSMHVEHAADTLGKLNAGRVSFRIVTEGALPQVLKSWTKDEGWKTDLGAA